MVALPKCDQKADNKVMTADEWLDLIMLNSKQKKKKLH